MTFSTTCSARRHRRHYREEMQSFMVLTLASGGGRRAVRANLERPLHSQFAHRRFGVVKQLSVICVN